MSLPAKFTDFKEIIVRFCLGGAAVVMCYMVSVYSPVKFIGGVFAAFPAVMVAAVSMAGLRESSKEAGDVARGAVSGMVGCTACVLCALYLIRAWDSWVLGLSGAVMVWLAAALLSNMFISGKTGRAKEAD